MNFGQQLLGKIFPPYRFSQERKMGQKLYLSIMKILPSEFEELKNQSDSLRFSSLAPWVLYPDFLFLSMVFPGESYSQFKKKGKNYKIQGISIFNVKTDKFEPIELLIKDNTPVGLKIGNNDFKLFDLNSDRIKRENINSTSFEFEPDESDILWDQLSTNIKESLQENYFQEIELSGRTFFQIFDLEDGNCIAINKK